MVRGNYGKGTSLFPVVQTDLLTSQWPTDFCFEIGCGKVSVINANEGVKRMANRKHQRTQISFVVRDFGGKPVFVIQWRACPVEPLGLPLKPDGPHSQLVFTVRVQGFCQEGGLWVASRHKQGELIRIFS